MTVARLLDSASLSVARTGHPDNQDRVEILPERDACLVLDGGGIGGALAARLAYYAIEQALHTRRFLLAEAARGPWAEHPLVESIQLAHTRLVQHLDDGRLGRSTHVTVTAALPVEGGVLVAHAGHSRAYVFRGGQLRQVTVDDEVDPLGLDDTPTRRVFRAIGHGPGAPGGRLPVDTLVEPLEPGDLWMLCTDGLSGHVYERDMAAMLARHTRLDEACRALLAAVTAAGGGDDASVVLARWG